MGETSTGSEAEILEIHDLRETSTRSEAGILGIHDLGKTNTRSEARFLRPDFKFVEDFTFEKARNGVPES